MKATKNYGADWRRRMARIVMLLVLGVLGLAVTPDAGAQVDEHAAAQATVASGPSSVSAWVVSPAQPTLGNRGGCGKRGNDLCTVSAAGGFGLRRYVSLDCPYYTVPERFATRLRWREGTPVDLWGCIANDSAGQPKVLVAPFALYKR